MMASCSPSLPSGGAPLRIAADANLSRIDEVPLERYLVGVLMHEVGPHWPLEALKAQAVASRTYALYRKEHPRDDRFDLMSDTSDQVYRETSTHPSRNILKAVRETEGEVLTHEGKIFPTYFHSTCGGMSEGSGQVWPGSPFPPVDTVHEDSYCAASPHSHWKYSMTRDELLSRLDTSAPSAKEPWAIEILDRTASDRALHVTVRSGKKHWKFTGTEFRKLLGNTNLKSTLFEVSDSGDPVVLRGRGAGHGVGLCQWGARGMAEAGRDYHEILSFYYPGAETSGSTTPAPLEESLPLPSSPESEPVNSLLESLSPDTD